MRLIEGLLSRPRLSLGLAVLMSAAGVYAWLAMPREEDPRMAERWGMVIAPFPGADAEQVERLVVEPIEEQLAELEEVKRVRATIRASVAIVNVELRDSVDEPELAWDRVEDALERAHLEMPDAADRPTLDHDMVDTESVVVALTGPTDVLVIADAAAELRQELLALPDVSEVVVTGDPDEQITIELDEATAARLQLPPERLAALLAARNVSVPGGTIRLGERQVELRPMAEMSSLEELAATPIALPSGAAVPLSSIASVRRMPEEPLRERARMNGRVAVMLGVVPRAGIDVGEFGAVLREQVRDFDRRHDELEIQEVAFQPDQVDGRLSELGTSLLIGIGIVALVLLLTMGARLGAVVASIVPLVTFTSLAIYAVGGGVLHQIAVAALVLALGLLVDNAIVMAEAIQRQLDEGRSRRDAVRGAVRELAVPLASATATTLAAFVPMLLASGATGDFTRAIPVMVMITLAVSYVFAVLVTPLLAGRLLKPSSGGEPSERWLETLARRIARVSVGHPWRTMGLVALVIGASSAFASLVSFDFFPASDREQLVVTVELPEGTHIDATDIAATRLERAIASRREVRSVATFVGRGSPPFYYNLPSLPRAPHLAQLVVTTSSTEDVPAVQRFVRSFAREQLPDATVVPRPLEQGPPVRAPVEVRLSGRDLSALHLASEQVRRVVREVPNTVDVRADHGPGAPRLGYVIDDAGAARRGVSRAHVATAMLGRTRGLSVGTFRGGDDPVPIVLRGPLADDLDPARLGAIGVSSDAGLRTTLGHITTSSLRFGPAVIHHRDRRRVVSVLADVDEQHTYAEIVEELTPRLEALELPDGVRWEYGGAIQSSGEANGSVGLKAPLGLLLLFAILLAQFDSLRKVGIVLVTAPLAIMGIWPGLYLAGVPFGFVALLGAIALIGIVVNGAIVLIDLSDQQQKAGASLTEALEHAVTVRTRPILLTTATTIAGLMPLLFSDSTLWPPMAAAMISGLTVATVLTLFAVPALHRILFRDRTPTRPGTVSA